MKWSELVEKFELLQQRRTISVFRHLDALGVLLLLFVDYDSGFLLVANWLFLCALCRYCQSYHAQGKLHHRHSQPGHAGHAAACDWCSAPNQGMCLAVFFTLNIVSHGDLHQILEWNILYAFEFFFDSKERDVKRDVFTPAQQQPLARLYV
jgi:hypothetical protein